MAGKPKNNNNGNRGQASSSGRRPRKPRRSRNANGQGSRANHPRAQHRQQPAHYVFAEPDDIRVQMQHHSSNEIRALLLRYFDNGGGNLSYSEGRLHYTATLTPSGPLAKALNRLTSMTP
uniref:Capsid protein n=1 Tax=Kibale red colobus virus 1 TaxID=1885929 RepID=F5BD23_9NIDO|nr:capsid protein [Kibale red colobus virus 1]AHH53542.1 capsid protein [Kibale red colobus virus 1]APP93307.1 NP [Kibale red colobus virus 1]APP93346.1 NP [Kibale red colobus virus 1]APP93359.1 NP [Kibale red colobus virus 1]